MTAVKYTFTGVSLLLLRLLLRHTQESEPRAQKAHQTTRPRAKRFHVHQGAKVHHLNKCPLHTSHLTSHNTCPESMSTILVLCACPHQKSTTRVFECSNSMFAGNSRHKSAGGTLQDRRGSCRDREGVAQRPWKGGENGNTPHLPLSSHFTLFSPHSLLTYHLPLLNISSHTHCSSQTHCSWSTVSNKRHSQALGQGLAHRDDTLHLFSLISYPPPHHLWWCAVRVSLHHHFSPFCLLKAVAKEKKPKRQKKQV